MSWIDWIVLVAFLAWVVWDGVRRTRATKDIDGYFAAGRQIPWWAAGLSVMATQASAITIIGTTGQGHDGGMEFVQTYFGLPFAMVLLCIFFVPFFRRLPILTAYEWLEHRHGPATRTLASAVFLLSRCLAVGIVIYAPAVVVAAMTGMPRDLAILCIGVLTTLYTMLGGVSAVIWTDVKQMSVILLGLLLVLAILLVRVLSEIDFTALFEIAGASGRMNPLEVEPAHTGLIPRLQGADGPPSFWEEKYNLWSGLFGGMFLMLAYFGCDQSQVQRILTNPSVRESRMALLVSAFAKIPMQLVVLFIGVVLFVFHVLHPAPLLFRPEDRAVAATDPRVQRVAERYETSVAQRRAMALELAALPDGPRSDPARLAEYQQHVVGTYALRQEALSLLYANSKDRNDVNFVFPHFLLHHIPPVLLGLIIAAIFAAAMSSVDSALNSLAAATVVDFYRRWFRPRASESEALRVSRISTLLWGSLATGAALWLGGGGSVIEQINAIGSFFYGALLGTFTLGLVCRRAGEMAGVAAVLGGILSVLLVHQTLEVEFLWYNVIGCLAALGCGIGVAWLGPPGQRWQPGHQ